MKKLILISALLSNLIIFAQDEKHIILGAGVSKHGKDISGLTYSIHAKQIFDGIGLWGTFIGLDKNKDITQTSNGGGTNYDLTSYKGNVFGFGAGASYCFEKYGITINAGMNVLKQKTIFSYYNTAVTAAQNQESSYKYYTLSKILTARIFLDYDFLRKNSKFELGVRAGYDTYSSFEVGAFLGYKFTKK